MPFLLLLLALGLAACGDDAPPAGGLSGDLGYVKSGGIAGRHDELVVRPDGSATLKSGGVRREFQLTEQELDALAAEAAGLRAGDALSEPAAPDARVYTVTYDGKIARTDDPKLKASAIRPLVVELEKILQAHR